MTKYQDPQFDKAKYWRNRKKGLRGQAPEPVEVKLKKAFKVST